MTGGREAKEIRKNAAAHHHLPPHAAHPTLQGYRLRQRLQELRRADPAAVLPEGEWQQWLATGGALRDLGEVLPLDPQDWYAVSLAVSWLTLA